MPPGFVHRKRINARAVASYPRVKETTGERTRGPGFDVVDLDRNWVVGSARVRVSSSSGYVVGVRVSSSSGCVVCVHGGRLLWS